LSLVSVAETSFTTRHSGVTVTCTGDLTMIHLYSHVPSQLEVCEAEKGPIAIKVTKDAALGSFHNNGMTVVYLDWETAKQIAELVSHRLEQSEHRDHVEPLTLVR
jgi:hypothetical protein